MLQRVTERLTQRFVFFSTHAQCRRNNSTLSTTRRCFTPSFSRFSQFVAFVNLCLVVRPSVRPPYIFRFPASVCCCCCRGKRRRETRKAVRPSLTRDGSKQTNKAVASEKRNCYDVRGVRTALLLSVGHRRFRHHPAALVRNRCCVRRCGGKYVCCSYKKLQVCTVYLPPITGYQQCEYS